MPYVNTYRRMEENMIANIIRLEQERVADIKAREAAEGAHITIAEHLEAKAASVDLAAQCACIKNRQDAVLFKDMFTRLGQPLADLSASTQAALKRYLTVREYAVLLAASASPARA